ncbi:MAG: sigma-70 family RNA polymerase sigma factor [Dehalococcoidia bacterium]
MTAVSIEDASMPRRLTGSGAVNDWRPTLPGSMDPKTLHYAYGAHREAAYRLAYRILGDGPASEDAVQDAFLKLWTGATQFDPSRGSMRGLLMTIARHTSIDAIRRRARRLRTEGAYCTDATRTSDGPEQATERSEDVRKVRRALLMLPNRQRSVIEMAFISGLTHRQIAAKMAIPVGTVKSRMRLGMRKLALTLGDERER